MSPGLFLPAAERYSLALAIDRWVIENTFAWLSANPERVSSLRRCSINLSGQSLGEPDLHELIEREIARAQIPGDKICFEITETAAISNLSTAIKLMERLRKLGCGFALDDFGSGMSSFSYLKNLPIDYLKIDGAFIKEIVRDPVSLAMVRSINEVGHLMGLKTIAEFVSDDEIMQKLRQIGVDYAQGYAISRPLPLEDTDFAQPVIAETKQ